MARPQRSRRICAMPEHKSFAPEGPGNREPVFLTLDEFEAIRLMDREGCTHEECAAVMQISRTTATEIYAQARQKVASAIVEGRALSIEGGNVRLCEQAGRCGGFRACAEGKDGKNAMPNTAEDKEQTHA